MLLAAAVVGTLAQRATARPAMLLGVMTLGSTLIYATGAAWLVGFVGLSRAFASGIIPFLAGDAAKAALATALVLAAARVRRP